MMAKSKPEMAWRNFSASKTLEKLLCAVVITGGLQLERLVCPYEAKESMYPTSNTNVILTAATGEGFQRFCRH